MLNYDDAMERERELYEGRQSDNETQWIYMVVVNGKYEFGSDEEDESKEVYDAFLEDDCFLNEGENQQVELCRVDNDYFDTRQWRKTYSNSISICKNF